ncbi:MAG: SDR family oxidoreductase, partial [Opitutaceae bacterium]
AAIIACARRESPEFTALITELVLRHGVTIEPFFFDFENLEAVKDATRRIVQGRSQIDILVNNAGTASGALFQMTPVQELKRVFEINFFNQIVFTQGICRLMVRRKSGSIVNIASTAALNCDPGMLAYGASKAALVHATRVMAAELGSVNVRVNAVAPNITKTDMYDQMEAKARDRLIQSSALKRAAEPREVAGAVLYLASDLSAYVTGHVMVLDGGRA